MVEVVEAVGHTAEAARATSAGRSPIRGEGIRPHLRAFVETAVFILPALLGPAVIVAYLVGRYHVHPLTVDGKHFADGGFLFDLHVMWKAGHDVVTGHSPYPFVYPAPAAILMVPFGFLPWKLAVVAFSLFVVGALFLTLRLLGVRDWRCYGAALASLPFVGSLAVGTLSTFIALCAAATWRYRDRRWIVATAIVGAVVTKLFLWPLVVWLAATRRFRTAGTTVVLGVVTVFGCWAMLGFAGLRGYLHFLGHVAGLEQARSYSPFALIRSVGASNSAAHLALYGLTVVGIAAIFAIARGRDGDRRAFVAALAVALLVSPIVWLHYLVLVYVVIALYRNRMSAAWLLPFFYWTLPGEDSHGSTSVILRMYAFTAVAVGLAMYHRKARPPRAALASR
ncbi:MAG: glycosyltransferase family 87 protein [Gaiellaceae bacterium]